MNLRSMLCALLLLCYYTFLTFILGESFTSKVTEKSKQACIDDYLVFTECMSGLCSLIIYVMQISEGHKEN